MSLKIGDRVKFLNDVGGGVISKIVDKKIVNVMTDDNWEIPMMVNELIRIDIENNDEVVCKYDETGFTEESPLPEINHTADSGSQAKSPDSDNAAGMNIYFALVKNDITNISADELNAFLINDSDHYVLYNYTVNIQNVSTCREAGILEPETKLLLETYHTELIRHSFTVIIQIIIYKQGIYRPSPPVEKIIQINSCRVFTENRFIENDFFDENAIIFKCTG